MRDMSNAILLSQRNEVVATTQKHIRRVPEGQR
jgi:hypothetical protein